jgi:hypothetical protein
MTKEITTNLHAVGLIGSPTLPKTRRDLREYRLTYCKIHNKKHNGHIQEIYMRDNSN